MRDRDGVSATTSAVTGQGGRYLLTAGSYVVSYRDCAAPARYFEQWSGRADLPDKAGPILVSPGQQTSLRPVTLRSTSAAVFMAGTSQRLVTISGTVRSRSGKRLAVTWAEIAEWIEDQVEAADSGG